MKLDKLKFFIGVVLGLETVSLLLAQDPERRFTHVVGIVISVLCLLYAKKK